MQINEATPADIPEILKVLKASLGEISSRKTEEVWRFKHVDNPFGQSLVLVAVENDQIIGVRAFMRWQWQWKSQLYCAFRAVDTATHPEHQGKGVFKKLTLKALEVAKETGDHFVFNTPNEKSRPGYLKMGWQEVDRLKVSMTLINPLYSKFGKSESGKEYSVALETTKPKLEKLISEYNYNGIEQCKLFTPKSVEYLRWRYEVNPLQDYMIKATETFYLAAYVKKHNYFKELRVVESIYTTQKGLKEIKSLLKKWAKKFGAQVISVAPGSSVKSLHTIQGKFGPVLTLRHIDLEKEYHDRFLQLGYWNYTLGDLELF